LTYAIIMPNRR